MVWSARAGETSKSAAALAGRKFFKIAPAPSSCGALSVTLGARATCEPLPSCRLAELRSARRGWLSDIDREAGFRDAGVDRRRLAARRAPRGMHRQDLGKLVPSEGRRAEVLSRGRLGVTSCGQLQGAQLGPLRPRLRERRRVRRACLTSFQRLRHGRKAKPPGLETAGGSGRRPAAFWARVRRRDGITRFSGGCSVSRSAHF
jgi:hypothetical protein